MRASPRVHRHSLLKGARFHHSRFYRDDAIGMVTHG